MIELTLGEIAAVTGGEVSGDAGRAVTAVGTDSRTLTGGELFVALPGEHADGHDYAGDAVAGGATALLVDHHLDRIDLPQVVVDDTWDAIAALGAHVRDVVDPLVVGITGSVGKTTTKDLSAAAVGAAFQTVAAEGSFNNELGVPLTLLRLEQKTEALVAELGSRGVGHIAALTPLVRPDIGVVTRVAGVHLERFGDLATVARAKSELVAALPSSGTAVLNADDERVAAMAARTSARVLRYSAGDGAVAGVSPDVVAEDITLDGLALPRFLARTPWGTVRVGLSVAGRHNVSNALAALCAAGAAGVDLHAAAAAIGAAEVSRWRGAVTRAGGVLVLNDAYNANPTSVEAALDTLRSLDRDGRSWAVLGVMAEIGPGHDAAHRRVGRYAAEHGVDRIVVVGADAEGIAAGARDTGFEADRVTTVPDAEAALALLEEHARAGDAVLVKASRVAGLEAVADGLLESGAAQADGART